MKRMDVKQTLLSLLLLSLILFLISFNINYFINAAPARYRQNIERLATQLSEQYSKEITFLNDFSFDQHVYIFHSTDEFLVLNDQYQLLHQQSHDPTLSLDSFFGFFEGKVVIVEKTEEFERFWDLGQNQIVFEFRR